MGVRYRTLLRKSCSSVWEGCMLRRMSILKVAYVPNRPTHFLSFPISSREVQRQGRALMNDLLASGAEGVDESLVVKERSLHLTIGTMQLAGNKAMQKLREEEAAAGAGAAAAEAEAEAAEGTKDDSRGAPPVSDDSG